MTCESLNEVKTCHALSEAHNRASGSRNVVEQIKIWRENPVWKKILQIGPYSFLCVSVEDGATLIGECVVVVVQEASLAWGRQRVVSRWSPWLRGFSACRGYMLLSAAPCMGDSGGGRHVSPSSAWLCLDAV